LTKVWKLDKSRLHATVFEGDPASGVARDDDAAELWRTVTDIDPSHIHWGNKKDNFWEMGETGPCGPCTEIHIDRTPDKSGGPLVNKCDARVMEIWNLVFIQFNRNADKSLTPLPAKHVDTGMGFERVTAVIQGKDSNYDTDVFTPLFDAIQKVTGAAKYTGKLDDLKDTAYRVIADHIRALIFAITDGALPANKGRGAVLRSLVRRAFRFGYQCLDQREPFVCKLVPSVVSHMGDVFPELKSNPGRVEATLRNEEVDFLRTIDRGMQFFEDELKKVRYAGRLPRVVPYGSPPLNANVEEKRPHNKLVIVTGKLSGDAVFRLYATFGFPPDLTRQMASERRVRIDERQLEQILQELGSQRESDAQYEAEIEIDEQEFAAKMTEHEHISRGKKVEASGAFNITGGLPKTDDSYKWLDLSGQAQVRGWVAENEFQDAGQIPNTTIGLLLDRTNFYAEGGGQVSDIGKITTATGTFEVEETQRLGDAILHFGQVTQGKISVGQLATLQVDGIRLDTMRNHTSTHLMNLALRDVLGEHVEQKGSLVDPDKTRFDFTHQHALSHDEIVRIERHVNERIQADLPVVAVTMPLADAKKLPGVRAVFGEKYPDPVRVVMIGAEKPEQVTRELSTEFCGGTHLQRSSQAGLFKIVSQEAVAKGVRRVTAVTGKRAVETMQHMSAVLDELSSSLNCRAEELPARVAAIQDEVKKLHQQLNKSAASDLADTADKLLAAATDVNGARLIVGEVPAAPVDAIRSQVDRLRQKAGSSVITLGWADDGKVGLLVAVTDDLVKKGLHAGKLVGEAAKAAGGKGGGNPTLAQAGGKDPAKLGEALALAARLASEQLSK
jgi:alanyl-tRNA synthetase